MCIKNLTFAQYFSAMEWKNRTIGLVYARVSNSYVHFCISYIETQTYE